MNNHLDTQDELETVPPSGWVAAPCVKCRRSVTVQKQFATTVVCNDCLLALSREREAKRIAALLTHIECHGTKVNDPLFIGPRVEPLLDLTASVIDVETGEEMLKPPSQADIESWLKPVNEKSYRIAWKSLVTGVQGQGHGELMTLDAAMIALQSVDQRWSGLVSHWIELVPLDGDSEVKSC